MGPSRWNGGSDPLAGEFEMKVSNVYVYVISNILQYIIFMIDRLSYILYCVFLHIHVDSSISGGQSWNVRQTK